MKRFPISSADLPGCVWQGRPQHCNSRCTVVWTAIRGTALRHNAQPRLSLARRDTRNSALRRKEKNVGWLPSDKASNTPRLQYCSSTNKCGSLQTTGNETAETRCDASFNDGAEEVLQLREDRSLCDEVAPAQAREQGSTCGPSQDQASTQWHSINTSRLKISLQRSYYCHHQMKSRQLE